MDVLTIQWGWFGGQIVAAPPPSYQPAPASRRVRVAARDSLAEVASPGARVVIVGPDPRGTNA